MEAKDKYSEPERYTATPDRDKWGIPIKGLTPTADYYKLGVPHIKEGKVEYTIDGSISRWPKDSVEAWIDRVEEEGGEIYVIIGQKGQLGCGYFKLNGAKIITNHY